MFEAFKSSGFSFIVNPVGTIGEYKKLPEKWFENFAFKKATFEIAKTITDSIRYIFPPATPKLYLVGNAESANVYRL